MRPFCYLLVVLALLPAASLFAQKNPKENADVFVTLTMSGYGTVNQFGVRVVENGKWDWSTNSGTSVCDGAWSITNTTGWSAGGNCSARLTPGKAYQLGLWGDWRYGEAKISAPAGYQVYLNGLPVQTVRTPGDHLGAYALDL